jgi:hypothetical protein
MFGTGAGLPSVVYTTGNKDLTGYSPNVSVQNSKVAWQANNVTSLTLLRVRQYDSKGNLISSSDMNLAVNLSPQ